MAKRKFTDSPQQEKQEPESDGLRVIYNTNWKSRETGPSVTFWLHTGVPGEDAFDPRHRAVATFPTVVSGTSATTGENYKFLKMSYLYVLPDSVEESLGQHRFVPQKAPDTFPYWYTQYKTTIPKYAPVSPHWRVWHWLADQYVAGNMRAEDPVFYFSWDDRDRKPQEATWTVANCVGKQLFKHHDLDFRCSLQPRYESVLVVVDDDDRDNGLQAMVTSSMIAGGRPKKNPKRPSFDPALGKLRMVVDADIRNILSGNTRLITNGKRPVDPECADPYENPYPFRLEYHADQPNPGDTYSLVSLRTQTGENGAYELTDQIRASLESQVQPEDLDHVFRPKTGDFDTLFDAMKGAATEAGCTALVKDLERLFAPWGERLGYGAAERGHSQVSGSGSATDTDAFCGSCGCQVQSTWAECPNCGETLGGKLVPPTIDALALGDWKQKCGECGHVAGLDAGTCPKCGAELGVQLGIVPVDDGDDTGTDFDDLPF